MTLRAGLVLGVALAAAGCAQPGRVDPNDASMDRLFIQRFGLPGDMPAQGSIDRPAPALARSSPWRFFARFSPTTPPPIKPPPPIPQPRVEPIPRAPARDVSWQPNSWEWNGKGFVWQAGRWVRVPPGLVWQYGSWSQDDFGQYLWRTGGWGPPGPPPVTEQALAGASESLPPRP